MIESSSRDAVGEGLVVKTGKGKPGKQKNTGKSEFKDIKKIDGNKNNDKSKEFKCFHFHKKGHYSRNCPDMKKEHSDNQMGEVALVE